VAARIHDDGIGFGIIDNAVSDLYVVVEGAGARRIGAAGVLVGRRRPRAPKALSRGISRGMRIVRASAPWPWRSRACTTTGGVGCSRRDRRRQVARLSRAGAALGRGERRATVVSTNTINLQEQLVGKDLPFLAKR
jgi:ATP-dependent DNA helicase DinG